MHSFREEQCTDHAAVVSSKALAIVKGAVCMQEQAIFFFLWWKKVPVTATELVC